jgi:NAD(P)-dependent dehydrogenase (short-subunit alcohol dehydrogenase family)
MHALNGEAGVQPAAKWCVVTGATSGIGRTMIMRLLAEWPQWRIILLARRSQRVREIKVLPGARDRLWAIDTDLANLGSVDRACSQIAAKLGTDALDALVLNAGVQVVNGDAASADGLELSFAVNHLANFLIVERLGRLLRPGARIVITSSEVHDPEAFCLMGIGRATWQDPLAMADPVRSQAHVASVVDRGEARYCASKLLVLMYVRHLAQMRPEVSSIAFNPSVVPGTDISRDRNWVQQLGWKYVMPWLAPVLPGARSLERSASDLLWLLTQADAQKLTGQYVDGRIAQPGSAESRDQAKIARTVEVSNMLLARTLPTAQVPAT